MGSKIRSLFFGRSSNNSNTQLQAAKPYSSIAALDPPVKGSYPVAGNGPNVLEQIQRKRQSTTGNIAAPPDVPRRRDDPIQRPRTAPHDGTPGEGHTRSNSTKSTKGRTMSGFSMKSPPTIFGSGRRNSTRSSIDQPPLPTNPNPPPMPRISSPPPREIKTYIPTNGNTIQNQNAPLPVFTPPFAQHSRTTSVASHKSHVDLLDAHSTIKRTREASVHRTKASGARDYGEDVADRNIDAFGERAHRDPKLDLNSPEFSYLKSVYAPKKRIVREVPHSRVGSALGHVLGTEGSSGDDTQPSRGQVQPRTNSMRSTTSARSGPRPASVYPPRIDSASAASLSYGNGRSRDDHRSTHSNVAADRRGRAMSPLSSAAASISEEPRTRDHQNPQFVNSTRSLSTPPIPERGRTRPIAVTTTTSTTSTTSTIRSSHPVSLPSTVPSNPHSRQASGATPKEVSSSKSKRRSMSAASQSTVMPSMNGGRSRKGSASYSAFPEASDNGQTYSRPATSNTNKRPAMIVEGTKQAPSLDGIVDLKDSVDTDVTTGQLPAVVHEHVSPTHHEVREEVITREIHNHDVYHRILPVIETEILPTKHYVRGKDGKTLIEIPESMVPQHTVTGKLDQGWHISKPGPGMLNNGCDTASRASTDSAPDGPVIGLARGEPRSCPRGNSKASSIKSSKREPILSSKKEYVTKEGIPKTEHVWRHQPVFETVSGQTQLYIGAGLGDLSSGENYYSDEDNELGAEFGAARTLAKGEEGLLFRDSGYGFGGMLPGLTDMNPASKRNEIVVGRVVSDEPVGNVNVASNAEGEAIKALRRMKERRRSSAISQSNGTNGLENGVKNMNIK